MTSLTSDPPALQDIAEIMTNKFSMTVLPFTVVLGGMCAFGLFGNILIIIIYARNYQTSNFKKFVITLAIIDLTSCLTTIPGQIYLNYNYFSFPDSAAWICKLYSFFCAFTQQGCALIFLLVAVERYRRVCQPLGWQLQHVLAFLCAALVFSFLLSSPVPILFGIQNEMVPHEGGNFTISMCWKDDQYKNDAAVLNSVFFSLGCAAMAIPIFISAILYLLIMKEIFCRSINSSKGIYRSKSKCVGFQYVSGSENITHETTSKNELKNAILKKRLESSKRRVRKETLIMFVLAAVFILSNVVCYSVLAVGFTHNQGMNFTSPSALALLYIFIKAYFINHILNPIVYGIMDPKFRTAVKKLFC